MTYDNYHMWQFGCLKNHWELWSSSSFYKSFHALEVENFKQLLFLCIFGSFLCIIIWLGATLKTYFYQKFKSNVILGTKIQIKVNHPYGLLNKLIFWTCLILQYIYKYLNCFHLKCWCVTLVFIIQSSWI